MDKRKDPFFKHEKKERVSDKKVENTDKKEIRQENFDKSRNVVKKTDNDEEKKPFDKKAYRLKKYSKKYKLEQWEEQRKKRLIRSYEKEMKTDSGVTGTYKPKSFDADEVDSNQEFGKFVRHPDLIEKSNSTETKKDPFAKAKEQFSKVKQDKVEKQQGIERMKEEKRQKMLEYRKKKQERFKKLSKKTKRGQPVMTGRLELLLEKIQKSK